MKMEMEMNINWSARDAEVLPELMALQKELEDKPLAISEFRRHFKSFYGHSIQSIVDALGHYGQDGYLTVEIVLNSGYLEQGKGLDTVTLALNQLRAEPVEADKYRGLSRRLYVKVVKEQSLNKAEVLNLPDKAKDYLEFKLSGIDRQRIQMELAIDNVSIHPSRLGKSITKKPVNKPILSLKLGVRSYDPINKTLDFGKSIPILAQKRTKKSDIETQECRLMRMLFKNVKTLNRGLNMTTFTPSKNGVLSLEDRKHITNYVAQINKKIKEVTKVDNLIYCDGYKVKVDTRYL
jgi:hypothetical protein